MQSSTFLCLRNKKFYVDAVQENLDDQDLVLL